MISLDNINRNNVLRYKHIIKKDVISLSPPEKSDRYVLLSYITRPFEIDQNSMEFSSHTNKWECLKIAQTWVNHGYNVDVIDYDNHYFKPKKKYSVFIDIHSNMERLAPVLGDNCKKILHITGAYWKFQNTAEKERLSSLKSRRGFSLIPRSQAPQSRGIEFADCATILGNEFTKGTFSESGKNLKNNNPEEILGSILDLSQKPVNKLQKMSRGAWIYARTHHTRKNVSNCYNEFVDKFTRQVAL